MRRGRIDCGLRFGFRRFGPVRIATFEYAQPGRNGGKQQLIGMLAHQIGTVRPRRGTDRRDADQHDQDESGFQNFGIGLSAHEAARTISDVQRADAGDSELERCEKCCKLDQPCWAEAEQPADAEQKLLAA